MVGHRSVFHRPSILLAFLWPLSLGTAVRGGDAKLTLEEIIQTVRDQEVLYQNIDVTMETEYEVLGRGPMADRRIESGQGFREILKEHARHRYVFQDGLYLSERVASFTTSDGARQDVPVAAAFNGKETRALTDRLANVYGERQDVSVPIWPHTLLLSSVQVPLSVYLAGAGAMRRHERGTPDAEAGPREVQGREEWRGEPAVKVVAYFAPGPQHTGKWEIWLAENRGFIPVRTVSYQYWISSSIPTGESEVLEWREVEPGIWFPAHIRTTTIRPDLLQREGRVVPNSIREWRLQSVSLNPHHDASFFTVNFPPGTVVYEVSGDQIVRRRQVDSPGTRAASGVRRPWLLALGVLSCVAAIIVYLGARRLRKSRWQPATKGASLGGGPDAPISND